MNGNDNGTPDFRKETDNRGTTVSSNVNRDTTGNGKPEARRLGCVIALAIAAIVAFALIVASCNFSSSNSAKKPLTACSDYGWKQLKKDKKDGDVTCDTNGDGKGDVEINNPDGSFDDPDMVGEQSLDNFKGFKKLKKPVKKAENKAPAAPKAENKAPAPEKAEKAPKKAKKKAKKGKKTTSRRR